MCVYSQNVSGIHVFQSDSTINDQIDVTYIVQRQSLFNGTTRLIFNRLTNTRSYVSACCINLWLYFQHSKSNRTVSNRYSIDSRLSFHTESTLQIQEWVVRNYGSCNGLLILAKSRKFYTPVGDKVDHPSFPQLRSHRPGLSGKGCCISQFVLSQKTIYY